MELCGQTPRGREVRQQTVQVPTLTIAAKNLATEMTNHKVLHADMQGERAITRELFEDELGLLNLIVDQYLSFAEAQARQKKVMTPTAWIDTLHAFLELNEKEILQGAGQVSRQLVDEPALREYDKLLNPRHEISPVEIGPLLPDDYAYCRRGV